MPTYIANVVRIPTNFNDPYTVEIEAPDMEAAVKKLRTKFGADTYAGATHCGMTRHGMKPSLDEDCLQEA